MLRSWVVVVVLFVMVNGAFGAEPASQVPAVVVPTIAAPPIGLGESGFYLGSVESGFQLRLRGVVQVDGRDYPNDTELASSDGFLIRRARPIIEGTVVQFIDFRIMPDFGQGQAVLYDAFVDVQPIRAIGFRAGKEKSPFGLERSQAEQSLTFVERGLPGDLAPDRDIGASIHGEVASVASYEVGIFDGAPDGNSVDLDNNGAKDVDARLFLHPLAPLHIPAIEKIGIGGAVTAGRENGTPGSPSLAPYKTAGQITFFSYSSDSPATAATVVASGDRFRYMPQANAYVGPVGVFAEYVGERVNVSRSGRSAALENHAWQAATSVVVTGEAAGFNGVNPKRPLGSHGYGAVELGARIEGLDVDPKSFPSYADPSKSAQRARAFATEVNWYLNRNTKFATQFERTSFTGGAKGGNRAPEYDLIGRFQVFF